MTRRCRNAVYWAAPDRTYALSRRETPEQAKCPKCGNVLSLEPFTRSEKIYICGNPECKWKIQKSKVVTRVNIKIGSDLERIAKDLVAFETTWAKIRQKARENPILKKLVDLTFEFGLEYQVVQSFADGKIEKHVRQPWLEELSGPFNQVYDMISDGKLKIAADDPMASEKMTALYVKFHSWATKLAMSRPSGAPITTQIIDGMANVSNKIRGKEGLTGRAAVEAIVEAMKDDFTMEAQPIMSLAKKYGYSTIRKMFSGY